ncbi:MAG TPA: EI24 domain-containing protein [Sphingopyxis sp.]|uniref:EI24 domain-containing protein n=1 Tax=Sphingopyxis sp. TaxID=1908224 RepID=UPI002E327015|nr:EI24 domain-containing protein [Sphingopyxis sp.]HEX2813913.1 EI24 domain-containing protein [Sphingopyxis sp.]
MARAVHALLLALRDLPHPRVLRVLAASLALTLLIFAGAGAAIFFAARWVLEHWKWLDGATLDMAGVFVMLLLIAASWLLFRAVAILVVGLFADGIVADVEGRHYPAAAARAVPVSFAKSLRLGLASVGRLVAVNLIALPFYIVLLFTAVGAPLLAFVLNAALLGRDLEAMILARHPDRPRLGRSARWSLGALSAASFLVPVANLLAPIVGAAMAVHLLHLRDGEE